MRTLTMKTPGMSCGHCVGGAAVAYEPAAVGRERIARAVEAGGYAARPVAA